MVSVLSWLVSSLHIPTMQSVSNSPQLVLLNRPGQQFRAIYDSKPGECFSLSGDIAGISGTIYLPQAQGYM